MEQQLLHRKLIALWQRGQSRFCEVRGSEIHGRGVYATCFIPKETRIIEYLGELISKKQSERRGLSQHVELLQPFALDGGRQEQSSGFLELT